MFFFIFFSNITEVIPGIQFPANARFGIPVVLALMVWAIYWIVGFIKQGPLTYLKNATVPPGVPKAILRSSLIEFCRSCSSGCSRRPSDSSRTCWPAT